MPNLCQPQGVTLLIALAVAQAFYPVEFKENGQTTIPNLVNITGKGNAGTAELVVNDGLLRTHQDSMVFAVDNSDGDELTVNLHIAKQPIVTDSDFTKATADKDAYFVKTFAVLVKADETRHLELRLINGQYVLSDRNLDLPTV